MAPDGAVHAAGGVLAPARVRHLRTRAQFQALLAQRPVARTPHFALHRLQTLDVMAADGATPLFHPAGAAWLGAMAPKRWARRAVTRNAIRRQIYALGSAAAPVSDAGVARLVRLRAAFAVQQFPSATSAALKAAVRRELAELFARERP